MRRTLLGALLPLAFILAVPARGQVMPTNAIAVDANGQVLGPVNDPALGVVAMEAGGEVIALLVKRHYLTTMTTAEVYFAATDCSGPPFIPLVGHHTFINVMAPSAIVGPSNSVYVGPRTTGQLFAFNSVLANGAACQAASGSLEAAAPAQF